jgi:hypothetical protein
VAGSLWEETDKVAREWRADHEAEGMNPFRTMLRPLQATFRLERPTWEPYLFWDLAADMRVSSDQEGAVTRRMRDDETELLRQRRLNGVLFATMGSQRAAAS